MHRNQLNICIVSLLLSLSFLTCSKDEQPKLPTEKMPISTNSQAALKDFEQARIFADRLQNVQAEEYFRKATEKDPSFALAWLNLAFVSPDFNLFKAALDSAKVHAGKTSKAEQLMIRAADFGLQSNNMKQRATLHKLVAKYSGDERAHLLLGNYYFGVQQYKLAIKSYTNAIAINKNMASPYNQLGYSQRALCNYGET